MRKVLLGLGLVVVLIALFGVRLDLPAEQVDAQYRTPSSRFATLADGTRMHYWDRGDRGAKVLVLLHGSYDSANTWEQWAPLLERDFHLIVPDLPAHGLTGKTPANDYTIDAMVEALHGLLDTLSIARASLAGNSMGGNVSWRYALAYPQQVERLVLVDSAAYPGLKPAGALPLGNPLVRLAYRYGNPRPLVKKGFQDAVVDPSIFTDARIDRATAFLRRAGSREANAKRMAQRAINGQPYQRIREIAQPTLILWGEQDPLIPVAHAHKFARDLPHATLIVYPGVGHMPQLELSERSSRDAREFLLAAAD
jgi:pimeloyl-ACP methyl ester carboxylesterase